MLRTDCLDQFLGVFLKNSGQPIYLSVYPSSLNYFVARAYYEEDKWKHKNPPTSKDIVGFELHVNWDMPIVLVEGAFDAIAIKRNAIPLFGKTISNTLKKRIVEKGVKQIGSHNHQKVPNLLIVDGQQRLTSLFAVLKGISVIRENYESEKIEIAFKPLEGKFEVADAGIRRSPEWIHNISVCFESGASQYAIIGNYLIQNLETNQCGDKALSVGESSILNLKSINGINSNTGIASKDSSIVSTENLYFNNVKTCLSAYNKKQEFNGGIIILINDFACKNFIEKFETDKYSKIIKQGEVN